jgi:hypothetical protein
MGGHRERERKRREGEKEEREMEGEGLLREREIKLNSINNNLCAHGDKEDISTFVLRLLLREPLHAPIWHSAR